MSLEDEVKDAFRKHGEDARPDQQSWNAVEKKVRRAHHQRVALISTLTVALIAAAAVAVPVLTTEKATKHGFIGTPSGTPTPPTSPSPTVSHSPDSSVYPSDLHGTYRDDVQGWVISYPDDWKESRFEGVTEFTPPGSPSPEKGAPTFWVAVSIYPGRPLSKSNAPVTATTGFDRRISDVAITGLPGGGQRRVYTYDWTGLCISTDECPAGATTLQVVAEGSASALWEKYHPTSDTMIQTLGIAKGSGSTGDVHTRYGVVDLNAGGASYDDLTSTLVRFLDARVGQANADSFMTSTAKSNFAHSTSCLSLYVDKATHDVWMSYEVMFRNDQSKQATFTAIMSAGPGSVGCGESIVVGKTSGSASPMILSDTFQSLGNN